MLRNTLVVFQANNDPVLVVCNDMIISSSRFVRWIPIPFLYHGLFLLWHLQALSSSAQALHPLHLHYLLHL